MNILTRAIIDNRKIKQGEVARANRAAGIEVDGKPKYRIQNLVWCCYSWLPLEVHAVLEVFL